jgi:hypothetical protein
VHHRVVDDHDEGTAETLRTAFHGTNLAVEWI